MIFKTIDFLLLILSKLIIYGLRDGLEVLFSSRSIFAHGLSFRRFFKRFVIDLSSENVREVIRIVFSADQMMYALFYRFV